MLSAPIRIWVTVWVRDVPTVYLTYSYIRFHIVKILLHHDSPRKHPMAHLFTIIRDLKHLHVQRLSAVLADCSINSRIIVPLFHAAFDESIPQTMGHDKLRRDTQDLCRYKFILVPFRFDAASYVRAAMLACFNRASAKAFLLIRSNSHRIFFQGRPHCAGSRDKLREVFADVLGKAALYKIDAEHLFARKQA